MLRKQPLKTGFLLIFFVAILVCSKASDAAVLRFSFEGDLGASIFETGARDGIDNLGVFGAAGTNLAGKKFQLVYTVNTQNGKKETSNGSDRYVFFYGGTTWGTSVPVTAALTVNDYTVNLGSHSGQISLGRNGSRSYLSLNAFDFDPFVSSPLLFVWQPVNVNIYSDLDRLPLSLMSNFQVLFPSGSDPYVNLGGTGIDWFEVSKATPSSSGVRTTTSASFFINSMSFEVLSAEPPVLSVPESSALPIPGSTHLVFAGLFGVFLTWRLSTSKISARII